MDKENVLIGHIMVDLDLYLITKDLSIEEKANYYDAIMKKYRHEDYRKHLITSAVEMCFKFSCLAIDKCKILGKQKQEQRSESARTAANARWNGAKKGKAKENEIFDAEEVEQFPWKAFYEPFPKHEDRKKVIEKWKKMSNSQRKLAIEGAKRYAKEIEYRKQLDGDNTKIMSPLTYLNGERWTDEYEIHTTPINTNYHGNNLQLQQQQCNVIRNFIEEGDYNVQAIEAAKGRGGAI